MADVRSPGDSMRPAMSPGILELSPQTAADLVAHLVEARAICRAVVIAEAAVEDGGISWGPRNSGPDRWSPVLGLICQRLVAVREIVISTVCLNSIDWVTFLTLAEAIDAAQWNAMSGGEGLDNGELVASLRALVALLDAALEVGTSEGLHERALDAKGGRTRLQ